MMAACPSIIMHGQEKRHSCPKENENMKSKERMNEHANYIK